MGRTVNVLIQKFSVQVVFDGAAFEFATKAAHELLQVKSKLRIRILKYGGIIFRGKARLLLRESRRPPVSYKTGLRLNGQAQNFVMYVELHLSVRWIAPIIMEMYINQQRSRFENTAFRLVPQFAGVLVSWTRVVKEKNRSVTVNIPYLTLCCYVDLLAIKGVRKPRKSLVKDAHRQWKLHREFLHFKQNIEFNIMLVGFENTAILKLQGLL